MLYNDCRAEIARMEPDMLGGLQYQLEAVSQCSRCSKSFLQRCARQIVYCDSAAPVLDPNFNRPRVRNIDCSGTAMSVYNRIHSRFASRSEQVMAIRIGKAKQFSGIGGHAPKLVDMVRCC